MTERELRNRIAWLFRTGEECLPTNLTRLDISAPKGECCSRIIDSLWADIVWYGAHYHKGIYQAATVKSRESNSSYSDYLVVIITWGPYDWGS